MLIIILVVLASLFYVIHDVRTKPTLQRTVATADELHERRHKARIAA